MSYPEHDKLRAINEQSQAIGEFLDWLSGGGAGEDDGPVHLGHHPFITERPVYKPATRHAYAFSEVDHYEPLPRDEWKRTEALHLFNYSTQRLLAKYFDIDLDKLEAEKRAMLDECRKANKTKAGAV